MKAFPMGYHITWGVHGGRLTGSRKPYVDRWHNEYGTPLPEADQAREDAARNRMGEDPARLTPDQREEVERAVWDLCDRYEWTIHALASQSDHTHVVLTALREGTQLRDALKAVATRALNKRFGRRTWWAEGGSSKYLWEREYFANAVDYVRRQRDC
jgi:REP element-mobilizing transposase RayT